LRTTLASAVRDRRELTLVLGLALTVGGLAAIPLWRLTAPGVVSDILKHAAIAVEIVESGRFLSYSLWYPLIWAFTAGGDPALFRLASVILLSAFVVLKSLVVYLISRERQVDVWTSAVIALGVSFIAPLVDPNAPSDIYLGQISATVWHNSTNIMVAPFALIAFWCFMRLMNQVSARAAVSAGVAIAVCVLVKPNFAIAMLPVAGVALLVLLIQRRKSWSAVALILGLTFVPAVTALLVQYAIVFGGGFNRDTRVDIVPFRVWDRFSDNYALSLALSLGVVALTALLLMTTRSIGRGTALALVVLVIAITQFIFLAEVSSTSGQVAGSGNWFWGSYTALLVVWVWMVLDVRDLIERRGSPRERSWAVMCLALGCFHVVSGVYYALVVGTAVYGNY
jgi:hypothetical protein